MKGFRSVLLFTIIAALLALAGCSSSTPPAEESKPAAPPEKKVPVPYTAQECFSRLVAQAHLWTPDAMPAHVESDLNTESNGQDGKSTIWRGIFASATRRSVRTFTCSGSRIPDAAVFGVSAEMETGYDPRVVPFDSFLLKTNSDQAFKMAQEHGGDALMKKDPQQPVVYVLEMSRGQTMPYWYVIYGRSLKENQGIGVINATTGAFVRATK